MLQSNALFVVCVHRSHAVLTVHLTMKTTGEAGEDGTESREQHTAEGAPTGGRDAGKGGASVTTSKLNLVDLAGSERSVASATAGDAAALHREGRFINKSLTFLEQVRVRVCVCVGLFSGSRRGTCCQLARTIPASHTTAPTCINLSG